MMSYLGVVCFTTSKSSTFLLSLLYMYMNIGPFYAHQIFFLSPSNLHFQQRSLARKIAWSTAMVTAAYRAELMWIEQAWLQKGFEELTASMGHAVTGSFRIANGIDAIRAADIPPPPRTVSLRSSENQPELWQPQAQYPPPPSAGSGPRAGKWLGQGKNLY
jgi:hypothetical protein